MAPCMLSFKITEDLDLVVFDHNLWPVDLPFLFDFKIILPTNVAMQIGSRFIMEAIVFFLHKRSPTTNDEGDSFHLYSTKTKRLYYNERYHRIIK